MSSSTMRKDHWHPWLYEYIFKPPKSFLFLLYIYECQHNNAWWQHSNGKMRFSHQTCLHFVRKWCYSLLTIFPHLWTAAAQKKNPIFRFLAFMISLHKMGIEIWNKLFKSATEITCIKIAKKNPEKLKQVKCDKFLVGPQGLRLRI